MPLTHFSNNTVLIEINPFTGAYAVGQFNQTSLGLGLTFFHASGEPFWSQALRFSKTGEYAYAGNDDVFYFRSDTLIESMSDEQYVRYSAAHLVNQRIFRSCDTVKCLFFPAEAQYYGARMFIRDAFYTLHQTWDFLVDPEMIVEGISFFLSLSRPSDGVLPQYVEINGFASYTPPELCPDNFQQGCLYADASVFSILMVDLVTEKYDSSFWNTWESVLVRAHRAVPTNEFGHVVNGNNSITGYGFQDSVVLNGSLFYATVQRWMSCVLVLKHSENQTLISEFMTEKQLIESNIDKFWNANKSGFMATWSPDGSFSEGEDKYDVWGNALIVGEGFGELVSNDMAYSIFGFFLEHWDRLFFQGAVRPLPSPEKYDHLHIHPYPWSPSSALGIHQNGSFWFTQLVDVIRMFLRFGKEGALRAQKLVGEAIATMRSTGAVERIHRIYPFARPNFEYPASVGSIFASAVLVGESEFFP